MEVQSALETIARRYVEVARDEMGDRLRAALLFGSVARGEAHRGSDVDLFMVAEGLPQARIARGLAVDVIDERIEPDLAALRAGGLDVQVSPLWKTPEEAARMRPLYLDMTQDARILLDRDGLMARTLQTLRDRLAALGSRRERIGAARIWHLKPDRAPGENIVL